jgi:UDP-N-acetylglucosamine--N-acetylmuramyl-(pentapeptide) pyrophosphoryl-undecaprenol N-acetylglucosamine transferase
MTCGELAAVGLPAIYVPLPIGNGEQRRNALPVVEAGGGLLVADEAIDAEWLTRTVSTLMHDRGRLQLMSDAASGHGVRDADEQLARIVLKVGGES